MKKLVLSLALALSMLLSFSSCSTDSNDPGSDGYLYELSLTRITTDLTDFYDINVSIILGIGAQQNFTITSRDQMQSGFFVWQRSFDQLGSMDWKVELKPKTTKSMDDGSDYLVGVYAKYSITKGESIFGFGDEELNATKTGDQWKAKGIITLSGSVTPKP